jgi:ribosomal protein S6
MGKTVRYSKADSGKSYQKKHKTKKAANTHKAKIMRRGGTVKEVEQFGETKLIYKFKK